MRLLQSAHRGRGLGRVGERADAHAIRRAPGAIGNAVESWLESVCGQRGHETVGVGLVAKGGHLEIQGLVSAGVGSLVG